MPQYLKLRFGGRRIRTWLAILYMILTVISQISVSNSSVSRSLRIQSAADWLELYSSCNAESMGFNQWRS